MPRTLLEAAGSMLDAGEPLFEFVDPADRDRGFGANDVLRQTDGSECVAVEIETE
jgi:hypothetical protein